MGTPSPLFTRDPKLLLRNLSYSQIEQLVDLDDDLQRAFYELECMRGNWSVRELSCHLFCCLATAAASWCWGSATSSHQGMQ
jgi:predicted nuclease of restriction endonuclease-like (RecB) superfamily